jgi:two-component system, LuxR family, sensor kinase FixL
VSSDEWKNITGLTRLSLALLVLIFAVIFSIKPSVLGATNARPRRVLILDSFGRDVAPFNSAAAAFRTTLARDLGEPVDSYEESLDMARFAALEKEEPLPSATVVQFWQPTVWQQYKWTIIGLLALCVFESALIHVLLRERRRRRLAQQSLEERLRFEQLVAELSGTFINLPPDKVEAQIIEALGRVGRLLGFEVAALSLFTGRGTEGRVAYIWRAEGAPEIPSDLTDKDFPWSARELLAGRDVCLQRLDLMPLAARTDRATYERYRVRSSYSIPMIAGGKVLGVLGLNTVGQEREISPELLRGQRLLGEIFANALARSAAEQSLRENEGNFRRLAETTAAVPWEADGETWTFAYVGPQAVGLLDYPLGQWYEKDFWTSHLHPEDRAFAVQSRSTLSKSAEDFEFEYRMVGASGATVWVHDIVKCERQGGKLVRLRGFLLDISERKQAQEALEKQRAFLRQVIDIDPNFIFAKDREGRFTLVNQAVADAYGTTVDSLIGKTDADFNPNREEVEFFHRMDLEVMETLKERFIPEERLTDARGNVRWLQTVKRPILDSDGSAHQVLGASTDITQRRETELELQRQREELAHLTRVSTMGELAASLAHELNQPLTAILSNAQAAQRFLAAGPADAEELGEILKDIVQDDSRASEVIRRMRALVRKEQLSFAPLDLAGVIRDVAALVRSDAILHGVRIALEVDPGLPPLRGDRVQLQQVVLNLLLNAFDAMKDCPINERRVGVQAEQDGARTVRVSVRDYGAGLNGDNLDRIFQPFYTTKRDGLGMGLSISRSIIEAHRGRLWAENNPDRGATFYFTVPAAGDFEDRASSER